MLGVVNNLSAMNAQRQFAIVEHSQSKTVEKLSSGFKVNRAADDAAGLTISEKMRSLIRGLNQGSDNINDGISLCQIADGALSEAQDMLHRMTELAVKSANGTNTTADRAAIQEEIKHLSAEISRIGQSTTFNTMHILDDAFGVEDGGKITTLVKCPGAEKGYLSEAINVGGQWHSGATIDFSGVKEDNIAKLEGGGFSFYCSQNCNEVFDFEFICEDGTKSSVVGRNNGKNPHYYTIDIGDCSDGADIVNKIINYVGNNIPNSSVPASEPLSVSHSNYMKRSDDGNGLIIYAYSTSASEEAAKSAFPNSNPKSGKIDCSSLTKITDRDLVNEFNIQCSNVKNDNLIIRTHRMNAAVLGVDRLDMSTLEGARKAIKKVDKALDKVSAQRSEIGAYQNRLESAYRNNENKAENTQAAESSIRDADMISEAVNMAKNGILLQVGNAMMAQANQSTRAVLALLQ